MQCERERERKTEWKRDLVTRCKIVLLLTTHVLLQALCKESGAVLQEWEAVVKHETKEHADKFTIMKMRRARERKEKMLQGRYSPTL